MRSWIIGVLIVAAVILGYVYWTQMGNEADVKSEPPQATTPGGEPPKTEPPQVSPPAQPVTPSPAPAQPGQSQ